MGTRMTAPVALGGPEDIRDLLGMRTRGAWFILSCYILAMFIVTAATLDDYTARWPVLVGVLVLIAGTLALLLAPGDPLSHRLTLALTASGPVACALVLSVTPAVLSSSLQTWIHGGGTAIYCFMNVRGRRIAPWVGLAGMVVTFAVWAATTGHGALYGITLVAADAAPVAMATLLSFTLRPTARSVFLLRAQTTARIADMSAQNAASDERGRQVRHLDARARPMLERIAGGRPLTVSEREECTLLEAHLRDRLRAPILSTLQLDDAAHEARLRGVEVVFLDDSADAHHDPSVLGALHDVAAEALHRARCGRVCIRMWPPGRTTLASVLTTDGGGTRRVEITAEMARRHAQTGRL